MAKAYSPIRLQQDLMQQAESTARRFHRSTAEQIEYWAELGRSVSSTLDPDVLLSISAGLSRLQVKPVISGPVDPDGVFRDLEVQRDNGSLQRNITTSPIRYQASLKQPGLLERIDQKGEVVTGRFENGEFIAQSTTAS
jgi:hypothetical protein